LGDFALTDRVAIITGANRGLGLETALALSTAGSRKVYCLDLPEKPGGDWDAACQSVAKLGGAGRLEYVTADVRGQKKATQSSRRNCSNAREDGIFVSQQQAFLEPHGLAWSIQKKSSKRCVDVLYLTAST